MPVLPASSPHSAASPTSAQVSGARTLAFTLLVLFLNLQSDGLPLGDSTTLHFHLLLLPFTLLFLALLLATLFPHPLARRLPPSFSTAFSGWRVPLLIAIALLALAGPLFSVEARHYRAFGYRFHPMATAAVLLLSLATLTANLRRRARPSAVRLFATLLATFTAITLLSLWSFPLVITRSDMLPLIASANKSLLAHTDPYRLYTFPTESVFLTYLPGTLLAFLPATLLHVDLRWTDLVCVLLLALAITFATRPGRRLRTISLLALVLLGPYLLYRHELYTPPHWLILAASLLLARQHRLGPAAVLFGISMAMSQFSWILFPFFVLSLWQTRGPRAALSGAVLAGVPALLLVLPFLLPHPHAFFYGVLSHWETLSVTARPVNLSFLAARLVGIRHLQLVQALVLLAVFSAALVTRACRTHAGMLRCMCLALAAFILLNLLVWGYFFLLLAVLLLLFLLSSSDSLHGSGAARPASHGEV